ncbi:calcofluor white hypersensitive protein-like protein [Trematosphaeria pertusa]|uniref:Calcofluor white hypersensitive protein-like protein n=1 Tax=Trematosphaeria pertusa TaxID=390896 RepID=A0A6A6HVH0_9PLEO|nr:calcofluor white hypersensitive protein-like protein [Trematosphaeria pertusa]KAF2242021.1 calcofluor white hypersensitive protein-like protein [Trematosphaeria pertusa]
MAPKFKDGDVVASFNGKWISWSHTIVAYCAFLGALVVGLSLHYHKIVQNEFYGYPQEWFPSVSSTIGDRYPERSVFMLFIAITSGPRFALVALWYILTRRPNSTLPKFVAGIGLFRTLTCGGWTYVTSTDDHDWHDIFMISYLVATLPWTIGCIALSPRNRTALKYRKIFAGSFFGTIAPLIYFFIQHKVHRVAGAYTTYSFFEWSLVLLDVAFDAVTVIDFSNFEIVVKDVKGITRGAGNQGVADVVLEKQKDKEVGAVFAGGFSWVGFIDAVANVYNGFVFWSVLTSLGVCVWYFPLWHMGISGYEVMVMSTISPFLLGIRSIRFLVIRNIRICHLLALSGLLAYLVRNPANRLFAVGFGVWMGCLSWSATFYAERSQPHRLEARISAFSLGLIASSLAKFAFWTNNPIWPIMHAPNGGWNKLGLALAIPAILWSTRTSASSGADLPAPGPTKGSSALTGLGLAGLFFSMHSLLSDSSTMILWVWEGYPVRGPLAVPHGAWTLLAMGVGLVIGLFYPTFSRSWAFYGIGSIGAAILTTSSHWFGYYGALALTIYTMAAAPVLISHAARHSPAKTFGLGFLMYNIMVLAHVWIVAYAFVPGGPLMREHTDWVMSAMMLLIGCGVFSASAQPPTPSQKYKGKSPSPNPAARKQRSYYLYVLLFLELLAIAVAYLRFPSYNYTPHHPETKSITAGIWTIHFSLDNDMWSSEVRMRDLIKEMEIDVIGLLESDLQRIIMGNRDTTQFLAEDLGMYVDYGPGPNKHTWGSALLSKFPIVNSTHHLLPSPVGELAPAIEATLDAYGRLVDVFVFHSGQEEDSEDRRLQSEYLAQRMKASPRPAILLSYLVVKPGEGNYNTYVGEKSGMRDVDPSDWDRWCEYILYKGLRRTGYARVSRSTITDTELQVAKFVVDQPEGSNDVVPEDQVPPGLRFPALFRGEGVRGHRYHVFDEPRYYA